ncbi:MAG: uncharacterized protein A8A55_2153, partial [Amphiamblys sp. WSBS2006]
HGDKRCRQKRKKISVEGGIKGREGNAPMRHVFLLGLLANALAQTFYSPNRVYLISTDKKAFHEADRFCLSIGMMLLRLTKENEARFSEYLLLREIPHHTYWAYIDRNDTRLNTTTFGPGTMVPFGTQSFIKTGATDLSTPRVFACQRKDSEKEPEDSQTQAPSDE